MLDQDDLRRELAPGLNHGKPGWNNDEPAVVEALCQLAVLRLFGDDYDAREVTALVSEFWHAFAHDQHLDQLKIETVIKAALGEKDVAIADIRRTDQFHIRAAVASIATRKLKFTEKDIDHLIVESERLAFERGWNPPLA